MAVRRIHARNAVKSASCSSLDKKVSELKPTRSEESIPKMLFPATARVHVVRPFDPIPADATIVNITANSPEVWSREFAPGNLGPVNLWGGYVSSNLENAWQFSKVFVNQMIDNQPSGDWLLWAIRGWQTKEAVRRPRGRSGEIPACFYWDGKVFNYQEARKKIYCPSYAKMIIGTEAYRRLRDMYYTESEIYLIDYLGRDGSASLIDIINDPRELSHGFVLIMLLTGNYAWYQ